jgi:hypothetical protein
MARPLVSFSIPPRMARLRADPWCDEGRPVAAVQPLSRDSSIDARCRALESGDWLAIFVIAGGIEDREAHDDKSVGRRCHAAILNAYSGLNLWSHINAVV